jgi:primary-amine oxidase
MTSLHPLTALTTDEIVLASSLIRTIHGEQTKLRFKGISLHEPPKSEVLKYRSNSQPLPRKAWVNYYVTGTVRTCDLIDICSPTDRALKSLCFMKPLST